MEDLESWKKLENFYELATGICWNDDVLRDNFSKRHNLFAPSYFVKLKSSKTSKKFQEFISSFNYARENKVNERLRRLLCTILEDLCSPSDIFNSDLTDHTPMMKIFPFEQLFEDDPVKEREFDIWCYLCYFGIPQKQEQAYQVADETQKAILKRIKNAEDDEFNALNPSFSMIAEVNNLQLQLFEQDDNKRLLLVDKLGPNASNTLRILLRNNEPNSELEYDFLAESRFEKSHFNQEMLARLFQNFTKLDYENLAQTRYLFQGEPFVSNIYEIEYQDMQKVIDEVCRISKSTRFQFLSKPFIGTNRIICALYDRFKNEGCHLSIDELNVFVNVILETAEATTYFEGLILYLIVMKKQPKWFFECCILKIENQFQRTISSEDLASLLRIAKRKKLWSLWHHLDQKEKQEIHLDEIFKNILSEDDSFYVLRKAREMVELQFCLNLTNLKKRVDDPELYRSLIREGAHIDLACIDMFFEILINHLQEKHFDLKNKCLIKYSTDNDWTVVYEIRKESESEEDTSILLLHSKNNILLSLDSKGEKISSQNNSFHCWLAVLIHHFRALEPEFSFFNLKKKILNQIKPGLTIKRLIDKYPDDVMWFAGTQAHTFVNGKKVPCSMYIYNWKVDQYHDWDPNWEKEKKKDELMKIWTAVRTRLQKMVNAYAKNKILPKYFSDEASAEDVMESILEEINTDKEQTETISLSNEQFKVADNIFFYGSWVPVEWIARNVNMDVKINAIRSEKMSFTLKINLDNPSFKPDTGPSQPHINYKCSCISHTDIIEIEGHHLLGEKDVRDYGLPGRNGGPPCAEIPIGQRYLLPNWLCDGKSNHHRGRTNSFNG